MLSKEQRAHDLAMMVAKSFTDTSLEIAKINATNVGNDKINVDSKVSLDLYFDTYESALAKLNLDK